MHGRYAGTSAQGRWPDGRPGRGQIDYNFVFVISHFVIQLHGVAYGEPQLAATLLKNERHLCTAESPLVTCILADRTSEHTSKAAFSVLTSVNGACTDKRQGFTPRIHSLTVVIPLREWVIGGGAGRARYL